MGTNRNSIYFSRFKLNPWGDGGQRRALQVVRLLKDYRLQHVCLGVKDLPSSVLDYVCGRLLGRWNERTWQRFRRQRLTDGEYLKWSRERRLFVCLLRSAARRYARTLKSHEWRDRLVLVDDPIFIHPLVRQIKACGARMVAVCHNIESLNRWQVTPRGQQALFRKEIEALSLCDLVVTISREETVLLTGSGIDAIFLPYYPPSEAVPRLMRVRKRRQNTQKTSLLLFGSSGNVATLDGMETVLRAWSAEHTGALQDLELHVAGFGTECLRERVPSVDGHVKFLGSLCQEALEDELEQTRACICHQEEGSGALTRIMDMLVAGVPVLANHHAARSYHGVPGVVEYAGADALPYAIKRLADQETGFPVPCAPDAAGLPDRLAEVSS